jgi:hypothetical protein
LPTLSKTFVVCSGCFDLYRMCPDPRPMEGSIWRTLPTHRWLH